MSRKTSLRALATVIGLAVVNSCSPYSNDVFEPKASTNGIFDQYVAIGNSITAGNQSGGILDSTQRRAYPFLLAQAMGTRYQYASLAAPGCPSMFATVGALASGLNSQRIAPTVPCALRGNSVDILNNVAVPGAWTIDPSSTSTANSSALTTLILGGKTQVQRALEAHPTFVTIWIGNNDVLGPAVSSGGLTASLAGITSEASFETSINAIVDPLKAANPNLKGMLIGVVNVANAPVLFRASNLQGTGNIKAAFDAVACGAGTASTTCVAGATTLDASCTATSTVMIHAFLAFAIRGNAHPAIISCAKGIYPAPVGDAYILDDAEQATVTAAVAGFNAYLQTKAGAVGFGFYDPNLTLAVARTASTTVLNRPNYASSTATFGTGMSLDGVHPAYLGHVAIANDLISAINLRYSTAIPLVIP
jgi:lysophospholipase L1-like esterase